MTPLDAYESSPTGSFHGSPAPENLDFESGPPDVEPNVNEARAFEFAQVSLHSRYVHPNVIGELFKIRVIISLLAGLPAEKGVRELCVIYNLLSLRVCRAVSE